MRIGELARRTGVSPRSLRYYEAQGLLTPERAPSGYRDYAESDIALVRRVRTLLAAGLSTAQIAQILPCLAELGDALVPTCDELVTELTREHTRMGQDIAALETTRARLATLITNADLPGPAGGSHHLARDLHDAPPVRPHPHGPGRGPLIQ